jgi:hypothetical protein
MIQYECDVDFFNELKQMKTASSQTSQTSQTSSSNNTLCCLITDEPLRKDHITLSCGHKFNYVPLFKEVLFQKCSLLPKNLSASVVAMYTKNTAHVNSVSSLPVFGSATTASEGASVNLVSVTYNSSHNLETKKLQYNEMKCPYCRTITNHILPYYPYPDVCKVKYVNVPPNLSLPGLSCEYQPPTSGNGTISEATCKNGCVYSEKYDMMLCNKHLNKKESEQKNIINVSPPRTRKQQPTTMITDTIITTDAENVIVSHNNPATTGCSFLLLSGPRKGTPCGKPMWIPKTLQLESEHSQQIKQLNALCKAHWGK